MLVRPVLSTFGVISIISVVPKLSPIVKFEVNTPLAKIYAASLAKPPKIPRSKQRPPRFCSAKLEFIKKSLEFDGIVGVSIGEILAYPQVSFSTPAKETIIVRGSFSESRIVGSLRF